MKRILATGLVDVDVVQLQEQELGDALSPISLTFLGTSLALVASWVDAASGVKKVRSGKVGGSHSFHQGS